MAFVAQHDGQAGVQERQFAQPAFQRRKIELDVGEGGGAGLERDLGAIPVLGVADQCQRRLGIAVAEADEVFVAVAPDAHLHPFGERVHHRGADAVQAAGDLVGVLVELAAGVQAGQHDLGGGDAFLGVDIGGNATAIVAHRDRAIAVQHQLASRGETGLGLIHGVVDDLERHMVQARAIIGVADVHAWSSTHCIEASQDRNGCGVIGVRIRLRLGVFGHADGRLQKAVWIL